MSVETIDLHHASGSSCKISTYGATILSWKSIGDERLFLSTKAHLDGSKAVRGGIPLVFPFFGPPSRDEYREMPQHGFARISHWRVTKRETSAATLTLTDAELDDKFRRLFPHKFALHYDVSLGRDTLHTRLRFSHTAEKALSVQTLLHTYLRVGDIAQVRVSGLEGAVYADKLRCGATSTEASPELGVASETDRVYRSVAGVVTLSESGAARVHVEEREGLEDVVVWNPWVDCHKMGDFGPEDGYKTMLCIEAGHVADFATVEPGAEWQVGQVLRAEPIH